MISNDGDLKMPIQVVREELDLHVTVVNPVLHSKHRSAALSPDPLPPNASFIRLSARDVIECQFPRADHLSQGRPADQARDVVSVEAGDRRPLYWSQSPCCFASRARGRRKAASAFLDPA